MEKLEELLQESLELIKCIVEQQHDHLGPGGLNLQSDERLRECIQLACESKKNLEKLRSAMLGENVPKAVVEVEISSKDNVDAVSETNQQNEEKGLNNTSPIFISESPPTSPLSEKEAMLIEKKDISSLTVDVASNNPIGALNSPTESNSSGSTFVTAAGDAPTAECHDSGKVYKLGDCPKNPFYHRYWNLLLTYDIPSPYP